ncbi:transposase [Desulfosarcina sp. OttesenSCG-928-G10]|nr:transposase [Desulfosarcina sp. OttesenSCG-928-G10]
MQYSEARKASVLKKMIPPHDQSLSQLAAQEGISEATLYNWRKEARSKGILMPDGDTSPAGWSARDKFAAVVETASLNAAETAEYCRRKGIFVHDLEQWKSACENANDWDRKANIRLKSDQKTYRTRIRQLEKELHRKDKALAETAALLVLQKKLQAFWGEAEAE